MNRPEQTVFVLWDQSSTEAKIALENLAKRPPAGLRISFVDRIQKAVEINELLSELRSADRVLIIQPPDEMLTPVAFETGLAIGLGKPIALLEDLPTPGLYFTWVLSILSGLPLPEESIASDLKTLRALLSEPSFWYEVRLREVNSEQKPMFLCPREGIGDPVREVLKTLRPNWSAPDPEEAGNELVQLARSASQLLWIVLPARRHQYLGNLLSAVTAGIFCATRPEGSLLLKVLRDPAAPSIPSLQRYDRTFSSLRELELFLQEEGEVEDSGPPALVVEKISIRNLKNVSSLDLDFTAPSSLPGNWTCIAGINGSGKTTILQAIAMVLLGERIVPELGSERLKRMLRRTGEADLSAEITAVVREGRRRRTLTLHLSEQGVDFDRIVGRPERDQMLEVWQRLQTYLVVSYGASRNLSDYRDTRHSSMGIQLRRQMTLFDPLTQVASVDILLEHDTAGFSVRRTLMRVLKAILPSELAPHGLDRLIFRQSGLEVEALDLPDGFRSTVAWLADLCAAWHNTAPVEEAENSDPSMIRGIVLLDEIDLHLHPSLQRALVPRLRKALPNVQFIVTTHSPLVLSSFDRNELVVLDQDETGGIRELDRQIFGFSADEIYNWLMKTSPRGVVIEDKLRERNDPDLALYFYQSEERSEEEARKELEERRRLIEKFKGPRPQ